MNSVPQAAAFEATLAQAERTSGSPALMVVLTVLSVLSISQPYREGASFALGAAAMLPAAYATYRASHMAVVSTLLLCVVPDSVGGEAGPLFHLNGFAAAALFALAFVRHFRERRRFYSGWWQPVAICGVLLCSSLTTSSPLMLDNMTPLTVAIALVGIGTVRTRHQIQETAVAFWIAGLLITVISLLHAWHAGTIGSLVRDRAGFSDQNYLGIPGGLGVASVIGLLSEGAAASSRRLKLAMAASVPVMVAGLAVQGSRSVAVALALCACVALFRAKWAALWVLPVAGAAMAVVILGPYGSIWLSRFSDTTVEDGGGRIQIWHSAVAVFLDSPVPSMLVGHGYGGSIAVTGSKFSSAFTSAHNMFLAVLLDGGAVGLALFALFLGQLGYRAVAGRGAAPRLAFVLLAYCLAQGLFLEAQRVPSFWCAICLVVAGVAQPSVRQGARSAAAGAGRLAVGRNEGTGRPRWPWRRRGGAGRQTGGAEA